MSGFARDSKAFALRQCYRNEIARHLMRQRNPPKRPSLSDIVVAERSYSAMTRRIKLVVAGEYALLNAFIFAIEHKYATAYPDHVLTEVSETELRSLVERQFTSYRKRQLPREFRHVWSYLEDGFSRSATLCDQVDRYIRDEIFLERLQIERIDDTL